MQKMQAGYFLKYINKINRNKNECFIKNINYIR